MRPARPHTSGRKEPSMSQSSDARRSSSSSLSPSETVDGTVIEKICVVCGANVAGRPRLKDKQGQYFCIECLSLIHI